MDSREPMGAITAIWEQNNGSDDGSSSGLSILCETRTDAVKEDGMFFVSELVIKKGESYKVVTESATFQMMIVSVEELTEE